MPPSKILLMRLRASGPAGLVMFVVGASAAVVAAGLCDALAPGGSSSWFFSAKVAPRKPGGRRGGASGCICAEGAPAVGWASGRCCARRLWASWSMTLWD